MSVVVNFMCIISQGKERGKKTIEIDAVLPLKKYWQSQWFQIFIHCFITKVNS